MNFSRTTNNDVTSYFCAIIELTIQLNATNINCNYQYGFSLVKKVHVCESEKLTAHKAARFGKCSIRSSDKSFDALILVKYLYRFTYVLNLSRVFLSLSSFLVVLVCAMERLRVTLCDDTSKANYNATNEAELNGISHSFPHTESALSFR